MRTKTLLLSAAALLAAGMVSSQAQVYSQNVVGYASLPTPNAGSYYALACPFVVGASNGINEVFGSTLPTGTQIFTWNSGSQSYQISYYDTLNIPGTVWYQGDDATPLTSFPKVPPGAGFFLLPNGPVTNVFAGTVAVNVGTSNNMALPNAGSYYFVSCAVPYSGIVTNGNSSTGGPNLNNLPTGTQVFTWNASSQSYVINYYDTLNIPGVVWYASDDATPAPAPSITVGQGFFLLPNGAYTWTTGL